MGNKIYIPPKRNIRITTSNKPHIPSSHQKPYHENDELVRERTVHPYEAQREAAAELNPAFVNPDGSINFWAGIMTAQEPASYTDDDPEDK